MAEAGWTRREHVADESVVIYTRPREDGAYDVKDAFDRRYILDADMVERFYPPRLDPVELLRDGAS